MSNVDIRRNQYKRDAEGQRIARGNGRILHINKWCVSFV
jgi:hypothetical protein